MFKLLYKICYTDFLSNLTIRLSQITDFFDIEINIQIFKIYSEEIFKEALEHTEGGIAINRDSVCRQYIQYLMTKIPKYMISLNERVI